jgi:hypothetical protein
LKSSSFYPISSSRSSHSNLESISEINHANLSDQHDDETLSQSANEYPNSNSYSPKMNRIETSGGGKSNSSSNNVSQQPPRTNPIKFVTHFPNSADESAK